ncbi:Imm15 family immunity protein [Brenneria tiliae]|uniref:Imm15 family immunity protein n=1 Tax=Brenneria tiliae TaxID=2914984 RepID=A0ABT0MQT8_9GAMM|nr:Imm15 family immunity protein [Brenneria tiliae]MCL2892221.1 Imm15 family immunity protein [Brenneria tiliae]MCL2896673.1 Imm15 family immunity protein [Brenneria tiliae]MCL2901344.1 Imm15 family immunity protein [Brenneria tiliae]
MKIFDREMKRLLHKEGLDKVDVYYADYDSFEEVPLFSRWNQISFLSSLSFDEKNKLFIKKGTELVSYFYKKSKEYLDKDEQKDYFICMSLTGWDDCEEINCLTPNIVLSRRKGWLLTNLKLKKTGTDEERLVKEYLSYLALTDFDVFVSEGGKANKRVYVVQNSITDN